MDKKNIEDLELMSNKDIAYMILSDRKRSISTADLFKKIIELLNLPESSFEEKIGEFYTTLSTDKRFVLLDEDEDEDLDEEEEEEIEDEMDDSLEDNYDATDDTDDYVDPNEDIKDLVVLDEDELDQE